MSVQDRHDRYDARCIYDTDDQEVRELTPMSTSKDADQDSEVDERLATVRKTRASSWPRIATSRMSTSAQPTRGALTPSRSSCGQRLHGKRQNLSCLYDAEQRHAVLAE